MSSRRRWTLGLSPWMRSSSVRPASVRREPAAPPQRTSVSSAIAAALRVQDVEELVQGAVGVVAGGDARDLPVTPAAVRHVVGGERGDHGGGLLAVELQ